MLPLEPSIPYQLPNLQELPGTLGSVPEDLPDYAPDDDDLDQQSVIEPDPDPAPDTKP